MAQSTLLHLKLTNVSALKFAAQEFGLPVMRAYLDPSFKDYTKGVDFASSGSGNFETTKTMVRIARLHLLPAVAKTQWSNSSI